MSASQHEQEALFSVLQEMDPTVTVADCSNDILTKRSALSSFIKHCCHQRKYIFGIKKCGKLDCSICKPPRLPKEVFDNLHHLPDPVPDSTTKYKSFEEPLLLSSIDQARLRALGLILEFHLVLMHRQLEK